MNFALFGFDQGFNGILPGAGGDAVVRADKVCPGDLEVENGLTQGLIFGKNDLFRRIPVLGLQAGPLAGHIVEAEKGSAFSAIQQAITIFHRLWCRLQKKFPERLRCYGRVGVVWHGLASAGKVVPVLMPVVASCRGKTWTQKRLCLEARVGIGRIPPSTSHSKSTDYGIADALNIRLLRFMSSLTTADFFKLNLTPTK